MQFSKAQESLTAAQLCFDQRLYNSAANRCYYAMFQAAVVALEAAGFRPRGKEWSHEGVQATFATELTRRRKLYPHELAGYLSEALAIRHTADYRDADVSQSQTRRLLKWAQAFVGKVQEVTGYGS